MIHQMVVLPFRETLTGWKNGQKEMKFIKGNAKKSCTCGGITHALVQTGCQQAGKQIFREGPVVPDRQEVEHEPAMCLCDEEGQQHLQLL